eukprot:TRINITY_DN16446_c0_g1_i1.p1 TRINITY_DN16446_c0_g1~~TRINITY_DN16446_c0_g1_i1.p1  ORF type:complete len:354 (+),score=39.30 TRINITY_DN16446_c0_g1_i1:15-1076(+)
MEPVSGLVAVLLVASLLTNPGQSEAACAATSLLPIGQNCPLNAEGIKSAAAAGSVTAECCNALAAANTAGCYCDAAIMATAATFGIGEGEVRNISRLCNIDAAALRVDGSPLCNTTTVPTRAPPPPPICDFGAITGALMDSCADAETPGVNVSATCCESIAAVNKNKCFCRAGGGLLLNAMPGKISAVVKGCGINNNFSIPGTPGCGNTTDFLPDAPSSAPPAASTNSTGCESANYIAPIASRCNDSFSNASAIPSAECCQALTLANDARCFCSSGIAMLIKGRPNLISNLVDICKIADLQLYGIQGCGLSAASNVTSAPSPAPNGSSTSLHQAPHWLWASLLMSLLFTYAAV